MWSLMSRRGRCSSCSSCSTELNHVRICVCVMCTCEYVSFRRDRLKTETDKSLCIHKLHINHIHQHMLDSTTTTTTTTTTMWVMSWLSTFTIIRFFELAYDLKLRNPSIQPLLLKLQNLPDSLSLSLSLPLYLPIYFDLFRSIYMGLMLLCFDLDAE